MLASMRKLTVAPQHFGILIQTSVALTLSSWLEGLFPLEFARLQTLMIGKGYCIISAL